MASRLIERETEAQTAPGYVSPAPVAPVPVVQTVQASPQLQAQTGTVLPVGLEIPTVLLANHEIEMELLGAPPRHATLKPLVEPYIIALCAIIQLPIVAYTLYDLIRKHPEHYWTLVFPALFFALVSYFVWHVIRSPNHTLDTLRYGVHYRAFVESVDELSGGNSRTVTYWHADAAGEWFCGTVEVPSPTVALLGIAPGYVFTLLVSPHGEGKPLPYFMAGNYRVVPTVATSVSHEVSARVAAVEAERLAVTAKQTGTFGTIEPELLQTAPRQVRQRNQFREAQLTFAALALVSTLGMLHTTYFQPFSLEIWMLLPISVLVLPAIKASIAGADNELLPAAYLAIGTPTRALVTHEENTTPHKLPVEKHSIVFRYKYESADGRVHTDHLTVPRSRAWHLGLCEGATFTVLYNPRHPEAHTPYFQIADAEIVGAMGAKVSPP